MYREEDFLQLSGIQHFVFCRRQWALSYIEMQWQENVRTAEGRILPLPFQLIVAGPLVRFIFRSAFPEGKVLA